MSELDSVVQKWADPVTPEARGRDHVERLGAMLRKDKVRKDTQFRDESRRALLDEVVSRIRTTMIGDIAAIEEALGHLWAFGRPRSELTPPERAARDAFSVLRTRILDRGHDQIRAVQSAFAQHEVTFVGHRYVNDGTQDTISPVFIRNDGTVKRRVAGTTQDQ